MEQAGVENKSLRLCAVLACAALLAPILGACEAINEDGGALPPAPTTVSEAVAPRATSGPAARTEEPAAAATIPAAPYQTGQHDSAYSTYWQEAQRQGLVVTDETGSSPSEFTQSYLNPEYAQPQTAPQRPAPQPVPAAVVDETTSVVQRSGTTTSPRYVTADGQPYPELDAEGLPVGSHDARATAGTQSVIPRSADVMGGNSGGDGFGVHLASYRVAGNAQKGWEVLTARHDVLKGRQARLAAVDLPGRGMFLRLKAGPFASRAAAVEACRMIEVTGDYCAVTTFDGVAL